MIALLVAYALLGLIVGSFLNVCIYRIPRRESIVFPGSHCPSCNAPVRAYDNVPVLAYLWLGGKCRVCGSTISLQYPAVELLTALIFLACAIRWSLTPAAFVNTLFLSIILVLVFIDYQHQILPDVLTLPGALAGMLLCVYQERALLRDFASVSISLKLLPSNPEILIPWVGSALGAIVGGGLLFIVGSSYRLVRRRQGLGMGDVKMMAMVGAFLGWRLALVTVFSGSLLGSLIGIFLILFRGKTLQSRLAFGTFLGAGACIALFYGLSILDWYTATPP